MIYPLADVFLFQAPLPTDGTAAVGTVGDCRFQLFARNLQIYRITRTIYQGISKRNAFVKECSKDSSENIGTKSAIFSPVKRTKKAQNLPLALA